MSVASIVSPTTYAPSDAATIVSSRTAPSITGPVLPTIARAPEPTKGQAWAFPDEEFQKTSSAIRPSEDMTSQRGTSFYNDSLPTSFADSTARSQYTTQSRLPPGKQQSKDDAPPSYQRRASSESQMSTHDHKLQHRHVFEFQKGNDGSSTGLQPYSRTPELRVSHKLSERKRRSEMKDLFDTLGNLHSVELRAKASKWAILSKGMWWWR